MRDLFVIFTTVFLAELGDKTQLATLLFASERKMPALLVFVAAAGALVASTALERDGIIPSRFGIPNGARV